MLFGKKKNANQPNSDIPSHSALPDESVEGRADDISLVTEKMWIDLAKIEQEVAELAQAMATRQHEAELMWERTGELDRLEEARQAAITAWRLEREILELADAALRRAKGELGEGSSPMR